MRARLPPDAPWPLSSVGAHFLAVSALWFLDGDHLKPMPRNLTAWLPADVRWQASSFLTGPWHTLGGANATTTTSWWEREVYDIRTEYYVEELGTTSLPRPKYLRLCATNAEPPWWSGWAGTVRAAHGPSSGMLMLDELIVNPR